MVHRLAPVACYIMDFYRLPVCKASKAVPDDAVSTHFHNKLHSIC